MATRKLRTAGVWAAIFTFVFGGALELRPILAQSPTGLADIIQTIAGSGPPAPGPDGGYAGDGGPATSALLNQPSRLAFVTVARGVLEPGDLLITDFYNAAVRRVAASDGIITSLLSGLSGVRNEPDGLALDAAGNVWIGGLDSILKFDPDTGVLSREVTFEGIHRANDLEFDDNGNLLIADTNFNTIYMLPAGTPTPVAETSLPVVANVDLHEPTCVHQSHGRTYICGVLPASPRKRWTRFVSDNRGTRVE